MICISENSPGDINLSCEVSGRPLTKSNEFGMFCDAEVCTCEIESNKVGAALKELIKDFIPNA
jgi:hypothetical protein